MYVNTIRDLGALQEAETGVRGTDLGLSEFGQGSRHIISLNIVYYMCGYSDFMKGAHKRQYGGDRTKNDAYPACADKGT